MEISIPQQLLQAAASLSLGFAAGFLYDFFRVIRLRLKLKIVTLFIDLVFWLICGGALFLLGMSLGEGEVRIFMILLGLLGGGIYFASVSRLTQKLCEKLADFLHFIAVCLLKPFVFMGLAAKKFFNFAKKAFKYYDKWYKIKYSRVDSRSLRKNPPRVRKERDTGETQKGRYFY